MECTETVESSSTDDRSVFLLLFFLLLAGVDDEGEEAADVGFVGVMRKGEESESSSPEFEFTSACKSTWLGSVSQIRSSYASVFSLSVS